MATQTPARQNTPLRFTVDENFGLPITDPAWTSALTAAKVEVQASKDLDGIVQSLRKHEPDLAYVPAGAFYRVFAGGDHEYRGLAICASKFTGETNLRSLLVVRQDDPANGIEDLAGADYGYINTSCSSTYYPPAVLLSRMGERLDQYLTLVQLSAGFTWEPMIQAVIDKKVRATMVLEDVWNTFPQNAKQTKVIGTYQYTKGGIVIARAHLGEDVTTPIVHTLLNTVPPWDAVYGGFLPYYPAQTHSFFHDLELLPADL